MVSYALLARTSTFRERHHITVSGQGTETVVLANGFGTNQTVWHHILPWLENRYQVVRFDWCLDYLHYDSARYTRIDGFVEDLLAVIMATECRPCIYIGHSLAGMIGMLAGKREPDFFTRMIMLAPSPCYINDNTYVGGFEQSDIDDILSHMGSNYVAWAQSFSPLAVAQPADRPEVAEFARSLLAMRPDEAFAMALTTFKLDLRSQLGGFHIPTTIIQTRNDIAVPMAVAQYLRECWPASTLEVIEASGHLPHLTAPNEVTSILSRVLQNKHAT